MFIYVGEVILLKLIFTSKMRECLSQNWRIGRHTGVKPLYCRQAVQTKLSFLLYETLLFVLQNQQLTVTGKYGLVDINTFL